MFSLILYELCDSNSIILCIMKKYIEVDLLKYLQMILYRFYINPHMISVNIHTFFVCFENSLYLLYFIKLMIPINVIKTND